MTRIGLSSFLLSGCLGGILGCSPHIHLFGVYRIESDGKVVESQPTPAEKTVEELVKEHLP